MQLDNQFQNKELKKPNLFQKIHDLIHQFFSIFAFKTYFSYLNNLRFIQRWFVLIMVLLLLSTIGMHFLISLTFILIYLWFVWVFISGFSSRPLLRDIHTGVKFFALQNYHLQFADFAHCKDDTNTGSILFILYPERNIIYTISKIIVAHVKHQGLPTFDREIGKIKELIKVGLYGTPRSQNPYSYDFFVVLPTNTQHQVLLADQFKKQGLKLTPVETGKKNIAPTYLTKRLFFGKQKLTWHVYQITL